MKRRTFALIPLLGGCSILPAVDLSQRGDDESRLDELADQLLVIADTPARRVLRLKAIVAIISEYAINKATIADKGYALLAVNDLVDMAWSDEEFDGWTETHIWYTKRALITIARSYADSNLSISQTTSIDGLLRIIDTLGLIAAMRTDIRNAFIEKPDEQLNDWLLSRVNRNLRKLES